MAYFKPPAVFELDRVRDCPLENGTPKVPKDLVGAI
jgi:hypothetical protein